MATSKRKPRRKPQTLKQMAEKAINIAEKKTQKLIHDVKELSSRSKERPAKRARKKPVRARARARGRASAHA